MQTIEVRTHSKLQVQRVGRQVWGGVGGGGEDEWEDIFVMRAEVVFARGTGKEYISVCACQVVYL